MHYGEPVVIVVVAPPVTKGHLEYDFTDYTVADGPEPRTQAQIDQGFAEQYTVALDGSHAIPADLFAGVPGYTGRAHVTAEYDVVLTQERGRGFQSGMDWEALDYVPLKPLGVSLGPVRVAEPGHADTLRNAATAAHLRAGGPWLDFWDTQAPPTVYTELGTNVLRMVSSGPAANATFEDAGSLGNNPELAARAPFTMADYEAIRVWWTDYPTTFRMVDVDFTSDVTVTFWPEIEGVVGEEPELPVGISLVQSGSGVVRHPRASR